MSRNLDSREIVQDVGVGKVILKWSLVVAVAVLAVCSTEAKAQLGLFRSSPEIKEISAIELRELIAGRNKQLTESKEKATQAPKAEFVVVDVRDPQEYQVSMIPGAITKQQYESNAAAFSGITVIPYCTVGGRSAQYAKQLAGKGTKVLNFKESIIGWCHAKQPLVTPDGRPTNQVHTYSARNRVPSDYKPVY